SQQVAFPHGALTDNHIYLVAAAFLVVDGVVLDIANDVLGLFAFDTVADERASEDRILAHVFEGSAVARIAGNVNATAEGHVVALRAEFAADQCAVGARS